MKLKKIARIATLTTASAFIAAGGFVSAQVPGESYDDAVSAAFLVDRFEYETLELPIDAPEGFIVPFTFDTVDYSIDMQPRSFRSPEFQVLVPDADGNLVQYENIPAPRTYVGTINEIPGSKVAGSLIDGELHASIFINEDVRWEIAPLSKAVPGVDPSQHIVFDSTDLRPHGFTCGLDLIEANHQHVHSDADHEHAHDGGGGYTDALKFCEIAFDADYEFYNRNGQSVSATIQDIESVMSSVDTIYQRDTEVGYIITTVIVRTQEPDPYSSTDPVTLLNQFRNHWNSQQQGIQRDVAHLMTGKNLNGGTIGIAYLSVICELTNAYGLSQSKYSSSMYYRACLTSHELGHNWSATHCDGNGDCRIMCSGIGGCQGDCGRFGNLAITEITRHKNTRNCLSDAPTFRLDIVPPPPIQGGQRTDWEVSYGEPFAQVALFYSTKGQGLTQVAPGIYIELRAPKLIPPVKTMDANGETFWAIMVPNVGLRLFTQAVDENGNLTNNRIDDVIKN